MSGTKEGALKARDTIYRKRGRDYFKVIGKKGGTISRGGGFACIIRGPDGLTGPERAKVCGRMKKNNEI